MTRYAMMFKGGKSETEGCLEYKSRHGEHFSKTLCDWAVSRMRERNGKKLEPWDKAKTEDVLNRNGVRLTNDKGYDKVYVINMGRADYMGSSIADEQHLAMYVKDVLDDPDGYESMVFNRFVADCLGMGVTIEWDKML